MLKSVVVGFVFLSLLSFVHCGGRTSFDNPESSKVAVKNVLSVWANWIKDKGEKYDIELSVANDSKDGLIVLLGEIQCWRGNSRGELKHTFFNTGERTIDFKSGEVKMFRLVCRIGHDASGPAKIVLSKVYANPGGDGSSKGKVLAQDVTWVEPVAKD